MSKVPGNRYLNFGSLGHFRRIVDLDAKVAHWVVKSGVARQQLNGAEVLVRR
jgi:hypothetical protein